VLATATLLPACVFVTMLSLNFVSLYYGTINTIPFSMIVWMVLLWLFVSLPLVVGGTLVGRCVSACSAVLPALGCDGQCGAAVQAVEWQGVVPVPRELGAPSDSAAEVDVAPCGTLIDIVDEPVSLACWLVYSLSVWVRASADACVCLRACACVRLCSWCAC
jgi:hypothetical protein